MARLTIEWGDPKDKPATFTRFVLPFAYNLNLSKAKPSSQQLYYEQGHSAGGLKYLEWREKYFTIETCKALFDRATWLILKKEKPEANRSKSSAQVNGEASQQFSIKLSDGGMCQMVMSAPQVVLFELPLEPASGRKAKLDREQKKHLLHIGFLIVETHFQEPIRCHQPTLDDLLRFNEIFRYHKEPFKGHREKFVARMLGRNAISQLTYGELENSESVYHRWSQLLKFPFKYGGELYDLVSDDWDIYADNRLFVWACAIVNDGGGALQKVFNEDKEANEDKSKDKEAKGDTREANENKWEAHNYGHWIKLLNVDLPDEGGEVKTHNARDFEREWAKERTYRRWEEWGTYYGFNYHSGALLAPPLNEPNAVPLWKHFGQMYFDMILLLLYLRIALFRFSRDLYEISAEARINADSKRREKQWRLSFEALRWDFTLFTNLYQFPLISNQQQGVEMYACARKFMDIEELYKEVEKEINTSHEYLAQMEQRKQSEITMSLTVVATLGLATSATLAFLALDSDLQLDDLIILNKLYLPLPFWLTAVIFWFVVFLLFFFLSRPKANFSWLKGRGSVVFVWFKSLYRNIRRKTNPKKLGG